MSWLGRLLEGTVGIGLGLEMGLGLKLGWGVIGVVG